MPTSPAGDVRICFVGDSFVAGVGDPQHLGWAGRRAAHGHRRGLVLSFGVEDTVLDGERGSTRVLPDVGVANLHTVLAGS